MHGLRPAEFLAVSLVTLLLASGTASVSHARDDGVWRVQNRLLGKNGEKSENVSGIACSAPEGFPRTCIAIDDERQAGQLVTVDDGELTAGNSVPLIDNEHRGKALEFDGEGVAFAEGFFYVIGSHGHPRDKKKKLKPGRDDAEINAKIKASSQIVRFRLGAGNAVTNLERTVKLRDALANEPALRPFLDRRLENNGVTIEGIAIRRGRLLAGLRGPTLDDGHAAILSVSLGALFANDSAQTTLHRLRLGDGQGVRDLAPYGNGILLLSGPSADGPGRYAVHWWDGEGPGVHLLKELSAVVADPEHKPEAILPLDRGPSGLRILILFDGAKEGGPIVLDIPEP